METTTKTEMEYLHALHGQETDFELGIDAFQFNHRIQEYYELTTEAKNYTLPELRQHLLEIFELLHNENYGKLPEDQKELLRMQQYVIFRHLLNNLNN